MTPQHLFELAKKLKSARSLSQKHVVLLQTGLHPFADPHEDAARRWTAAHQSGLLELLLEDLSKTSADTVTLCGFFIAAAHALQSCLFMGSQSEINETQYLLLLKHIPVIFRRSIAIMQDLEQKADLRSGRDISTLYQMSAILVGTTFYSLQYHSTIVDSIDKDALLRVILPIVFDHPDQFSREALEFALQACGRALSPDAFQVYALENAQGPIIQELMERLPFDKIASACGSIWMIVTGPDIARGLANLLLLIHYGNIPALHQAFVKKSVCKAIVAGHWNVAKMSGVPADQLVEQGIIRMTVVSRLLYDIHNHGGTERLEVIPRVMTELLEQEDLLLFVGKVLMAPRSMLFDQSDKIRESTDRIRNWGHWISKACERKPELMGSICRPAWTHVMETLLALDRCNPLAFDETDPEISYRRYEFAIDQWRELGQQIRGEDSMDSPSQPYWTPRSESLLSCSWARCPLYHLDPYVRARLPLDMLRCTRCRKVQYWGKACQKRDWKLNHRKECDPAD